MKLEASDVESLRDWWRPGALPAWVTAALVIATITTIGVAHVGANHLVAYFDVSGFWLKEGVALGLIVIAAVAWLPQFSLARAARVAIVLPIAHVAAIAVAWLIWWRSSPELDAELPSPFLRAGAIALVVPNAAIATVIVARLIAIGRRREWLHATVTLALVHVLFAGIWLSIAAQVWNPHGPRDLWWSWEHVRAHVSAPRIVAFVIIPPFAAASAFTAIAIRRFELVKRHGFALTTLGAFATLTAVLVRLDAAPESPKMYAAFVHIPCALAVVAASALVALAAATHLQARRARRILDTAALRGTIAIQTERGAPVACLQIAGWLRGPRELARPFEVVTGRGVLAVPESAAMAVDLPALSTNLAAGESVAVLREGDHVAIAGFVAPPADHPFRTSTVPVPGPGGVVVGPERAEPPGLAPVALALWRPCLAYLAVIVAIALPGLAAALAAR